MRLFHTLQDLAAALPEIPRDGLILIPETIAVLIHPVPHGAFSALFSPQARFIVQAAGERPRFAYRAWLSVPVFARIAQSLPAAADDGQWQAALSAYFVPPPEMPTAQTRQHPAPLTLPPLPDEAARLAWWAQCVRAYLDLWGGDRPFSPFPAPIWPTANGVSAARCRPCCVPTTNISACSIRLGQFIRPSLSGRWPMLVFGWTVFGRNCPLPKPTQSAHRPTGCLPSAKARTTAACGVSTGTPAASGVVTAATDI